MIFLFVETAELRLKKLYHFTHKIIKKKQKNSKSISGYDGNYK